MKYSIEESLRQIETRSRKIRYRKQRRNVGLLATMTALVLMVSIAVGYSLVGMKEPGSLESVYGSFILSEEAGGYVIVGVLCFVAAVILTLVCVRWKERSDRKGCGNNNNDEE